MHPKAMLFTSRPIFRSPVMLLGILFATMYVLLLGLPAVAQQKGCYQKYYQNKDFACVEEFIQELADQPPEKQKSANNIGATGFLAHLFLSDPDARTQVLGKQVPTHARSYYLIALSRAGLWDVAEEYAAQNGWSELFQKSPLRSVPTLSEAESNGAPAENDFLIGAYMASGDTKYIEKILKNFSTASDDLVREAFRLSLVRINVGPDKTARSLKNMAQTACKKYGCDTNAQPFSRLMTLHSAFWALSSLSRSDEGIKKTFTGYFENDPRLKQLLSEEKVAIASYFILLIAQSGTADNADINVAIEDYEALKPASEIRRSQ